MASVQQIHGLLSCSDWTGVKLSTLLDEAGVGLDMGTGFDNFTPLAEPDQEPALVSSGQLSAAQEANRLILRSLMTRAGFHTIPEEWWHFDALPIAAGLGRQRGTRVLLVFAHAASARLRCPIVSRTRGSRKP